MIKFEDIQTEAPKKTRKPPAKKPAKKRKPAKKAASCNRRVKKP